MNNDFSINRVVIPGGDGVSGAKKKDKEFELSTQDDFWSNHKGAPFPQVALSISSMLTTYTANL